MALIADFLKQKKKKRVRMLWMWISAQVERCSRGLSLCAVAPRDQVSLIPKSSTTWSFGGPVTMGHTLSYYIGGMGVNVRTERGIFQMVINCGSGASGPARGHVFFWVVSYSSIFVLFP